MAASACDVAIIGYGPVGAMLANLLGMSGLNVVVLEREASLYHQPRAVSLDGEGMRLFQTIRLAEALLPKLNVSRNIRHVNAEGRLLVLMARGGIGPDGWNNAYRFYQPELENVLRAGVGRHPSVETRLRCDVFALEERNHEVRVQFENLASGKLDELTARYVVGCDGARSTVRRFMSAALHDLRSHERWIVLDMILDTAPAGVPEAADDNGVMVDAIQYCDPARPTTFIPLPGKRHRWEFMLMPGDDPAQMVRTEAIYRLLEPWRIDPSRSQIERAVVYTFHSSLATRWRRGRLMLAGDAAHQMPPFLGQGMNSGLRDAGNLAWKLRDVVRGMAPESVLDSYESERLAHVRAYIELAIELGSVIQATDPQQAERRDRELLANPTLLKPLAPPLGPGLHGDAQPPAGTRAEQPRLGNGRRLDDCVGYRLAVLAAPALHARLPAALSARIAELDAVLLLADGEAADWLARLEASAVVIRPDRHVLGVASTGGELAAVLDRLPHIARATQGSARPAANT